MSTCHDARRALIALTAVAALAGCDRERPSPPTDSTEAPAAKAERASPADASLQPPAPRVARPLPLLARDLEGQRVGQLTRPDAQPDHDELELRGVALTRCHEGWALQGFYDPPGGPAPELEATETFFFPVAELPLEEPIKARPRAGRGRQLELELSHRGPERLAGRLRVMDARGSVQLQMRFDGPPAPPAPAAGLGGRGCFTTGQWEIAEEGLAGRGPAHAVAPRPASVEIVAELDAHHAVLIWLKLSGRARAPGEVLDVELAEIARAPREHDRARVFAATRRAGPEGQLDWAREPITSGHLGVRLAGPDVYLEPITAALSSIPLPEGWPAPLGGRTLGKLQVEVRVVTDPDGVLVPLP